MVNEVRKNFLPFCLPDITDEEIDEMTAALKSGWLAKGPRTHKFEEQFADYAGTKYAIGMNSCTAALHIALLAAGIGPGDEVITSPMTFAASANTIIHCGATPVFADIDPTTGCIDPNEIERKITNRTKAIVPVHYSGQACNLERIYEIAEHNHLFVSEDAAHAVETRYRGKQIGCGAPGAVSFSFYATKNLATGEGGMLCTDNETIANKARVLVTHGMSANAWNRYAKGGTWMYDIEETGYKYNMFDLQAALGIVQLKRIPEMQTKRFEIVDIYKRELSNIPGIFLPETAKDTTHSWHLFIIQIDSNVLGLERDDFIQQLTSYNIGTSVHFIPIHHMSAYVKRYGYKPNDFPKTEAYFKRIISLPLYSRMTETDAMDVVNAVKMICAR